MSRETARSSRFGGSIEKFCMPREGVENVAVTVCRYPVGPANNGTAGENITRYDGQSFRDYQTFLVAIPRGSLSFSFTELPKDRKSTRGELSADMYFISLK